MLREQVRVPVPVNQASRECRLELISWTNTHKSLLLPLLLACIVLSLARSLGAQPVSIVQPDSRPTAFNPAQQSSSLGDFSQSERIFNESRLLIVPLFAYLSSGCSSSVARARSVGRRSFNQVIDFANNNKYSASWLGGVCASSNVTNSVALEWQPIEGSAPPLACVM